MALDSEGFQNHPSVLESSGVENLREIVSELLARESTTCLRGLISKHPAIRQLASSPQIKACLPDPDFIPVRSLFFDKTPESNWPVARHQDLTIAVAEKIEMPGFGPWSVKDGIPHVQPPAGLLESMVSLRIHLDAADANNGALRVIPKSHLFGKLSHEEIATRFSTADEQTCECRAGDVFAMRPLLIHASSRAKIPRHRRVIHIEYALPDALPPPLRWAELSIA